MAMVRVDQELIITRNLINRIRAKQKDAEDREMDLRDALYYLEQTLTELKAFARQEAEDKWQHRKDGPSYTKMFMDWYNDLKDGCEWTTVEAAEELGLSAKEISVMGHNCKKIASIFANDRRGRIGDDKRIVVYRKTPQ